MCETAPAKSLISLYFRTQSSPLDMNPGFAGIKDLVAGVER
jgi:hypothetical protein